MIQSDIEQFLKGVSINNQFEVEQLFLKIQFLFTKYKGDKNFVVEEIQSKYGFDTDFVIMIVDTALLYVMN